MTKLEISSRLKGIRNRKGLTQDEVAKNSDVTYGYYKMIEQGTRSPSLETVENIAKALNVAPLILLNDRVEIMNAQADEEEERLRELFSDIPENKLKIADGLIVQASRLRVLLNDNWNDILENGEYEKFRQSKNQTPYDRKRPIVEHYDARDKTYKEIIAQLIELLPEENKESQSYEEKVLG